ncbi:MAG: hypothetical protein GY769_15285 [bacterium]|nr:hypothetical protein [bacterium]
MLEALRKVLPVVSPVSMDVVISLGTLVSFAWLLANGFVQPLAVYLLELYLAL